MTLSHYLRTRRRDFLAARVAGLTVTERMRLEYRRLCLRIDDWMAADADPEDSSPLWPFLLLAASIPLLLIGLYLIARYGWALLTIF